MTDHARTHFIADRARLLLLLLVALAVGSLAQLPSAPAAHAEPGDPPAQRQFGKALQAIIASGMPAHAAVGHLLYDAGALGLAKAWCAAGMSADDAEEALTNAVASNPAELAKYVAERNIGMLTDAFGNRGRLSADTTPRRLLNALRVWMWRSPNGRRFKLADVLDLALADADAGVTEEWLVDRLTTDYPWNRLPEKWSTEVKGSLRVLPVGDAKGDVTPVRILTVWGSDFERGYAHGRLLGRDVLELWSQYALRIAAFKGGYQNICELQDMVFDFPASYEQEMKGLMAGILDSVPAEERETYTKLVGRDLRLVDLKAGNTLSDWAEFGCSSVSVWGDRTSDGRVLTARNLDYQTMGGMLNKYHLVVVQAPQPATATSPARHGWVSLAFTGAIGCYTGMNDQGVTAMMHNTPGHYTRTIGIVPRAFSQRTALELADAANMPDSFATALREMHHLVPSNIHTSWPRLNGKVDPRGQAAAMELDGYTPLHEGVTVRRPEHNAAGVAHDLFVVTNHFCRRFTPTDREDGMPPELGAPGNSPMRFATLQDAAGAAPRGSVDVPTIRDWLKKVCHPGTAHSVVFSPDTREVYALQPVGSEGRGGPYAHMNRLSVDALMAAAKAASLRRVADF